jgi:hypothetical protein
MSQRHPKGYHPLCGTPPISTQLTAISGIAFTMPNSTENRTTAEPVNHLEHLENVGVGKLEQFVLNFV